MAEVALAEPLNGTVDLAGPETIRQDDLVRQFLNATGDARRVITDPKALYYGIAVNDQTSSAARKPADFEKAGTAGDPGGKGGNNESWCTLVVVRTGDLDELVLVESSGVTAYNPKTGKSQWTLKRLPDLGSSMEAVLMKLQL
jgi:hypothetical protein